MEIRELEKKELKLLRNALKFYGSLDFLSSHTFFVVEGKVRELFMCTRDVWELKNELKNIDPVSIGIKVGEIGSRRIRLTLEGAFYFVKDRKRVFVNERGEMLFLYGRDIFGSSVVDVDDDIRENDIVFISNTFNDILGIGRARYSSPEILEIDDERVVVENLIDRGEYLRKKRLYNAY